MFKKKIDETKLISFFLRMGLTIVFLYASIAILLNPSVWLGFIPSWLTNIIPEKIFLITHVIMNLIIGIWLLTGKKQFYASLIASLSLTVIIIFNLRVLDIIFRDIAILFSAISLMILHLNEVKEK